MSSLCFNSISKGKIVIINHSSRDLIEVKLDDGDNMHMTYEQFNELSEVIMFLKKEE